jgi:hypothetical protein
MSFNKKVSELNDKLRKNFIGGRIMLSRGVDSSEIRDRIIASIKSFTDFNADNDPYGEHDCASVDVDGRRYLFKIDYYDKNYEYGVEPTDPECKRVMTIMRSDEY